MSTETLTNKVLVDKGYNSILISKYGIDPDEDGVTHINIGDLAKTKLGRMLDIYSNRPFLHSKLGSFKSLGGLYYYLKYNYNESFRDSYGYQVKKLVKGMGVPRRKPNLEFKLMIADSIYYRIMDDKELILELLNDDLKDLSFKCYYIDYNGTPKENNIGNWYIPILNTIRDSLAKNISVKDKLIADKTLLDTIPYPNFNIS